MISPAMSMFHRKDAKTRSLPKRTPPLHAIFIAVLLLCFVARGGAEPLPASTAVRGWTILSNSEPDAMAVIAAAMAYNINHLELSHEIVMDLREIRDAKRQALVNRLVNAAHKGGIQEVLLWDHALYDLAYLAIDEFHVQPSARRYATRSQQPTANSRQPRRCSL